MCGWLFCVAGCISDPTVVSQVQWTRHVWFNMNQRPGVIQYVLRAQYVLIMSCWIPTHLSYILSLNKKKYFEQEDEVCAYQTGKNKYTLLTTFRTHQQLCTTGPEVRRKEVKWTLIVQFRMYAVWFQTETPFSKLYIRARLAVVWAKGQ